MENKSKGIVLILMSALFFALMAATVKSIPNIPVTEKIFFRNIFGFIFALIIVKKKGKPLLGNNKRLLLFRSFCGLLGVACYFLALSKIRLADAVILNKFSPFFILILSYIFLKEKIKKFQVVSLILAILGAGFVIKPGLNLTIIPSLIALASALFAGCAYTAIRYLRHTDAPETIVLYFTFISTISMIPFMLSGQFVIPNQAQITRLISLGIFATSAQFLMTYAYRYAPASELSIYTYANIVFSSIIGLLVWNETLDFMTVIGALLIITSGILNYIVNNNIKLKKLP
ncbi:DMT family transporter [Abyssisolibacter fermentans]|uniref:DMT family transporter n=1 Tax=Abyssisolibacter fermentans TaxID=1766203 RepID=UPI000836CB24|nr:DMT family transporter [Abyssisolibacter fermentans]